MRHNTERKRRAGGKPWSNLELTLSFSGQLSLQVFLACIFDYRQHTVWICLGFVACKNSAEYAVGAQLALLEERPHLPGELRLQQFRRKAAESVAYVVHIPLEHRECVVVPGRVDCLRQV